MTEDKCATMEKNTETQGVPSTQTFKCVYDVRITQCGGAATAIDHTLDSRLFPYGDPDPYGDGVKMYNFSRTFQAQGQMGPFFVGGACIHRG